MVYAAKLIESDDLDLVNNPVARSVVRELLSISPKQRSNSEVCRAMGHALRGHGVSEFSTAAIEIYSSVHEPILAKYRIGYARLILIHLSSTFTIGTISGDE